MSQQWKAKFIHFTVYGHALWSTVWNWFSSERWGFVHTYLLRQLLLELVDVFANRVGLLHVLAGMPKCQLIADTFVVWSRADLCLFIVSVWYMCRDLCYTASCLLHQVAVEAAEPDHWCILWQLWLLLELSGFCLLCSCPVPGSESTLEVLKNGQGPEAMFRIQMFKFVGSSYTDVFLHCNVQICPSPSGVCQPVRIMSVFLKVRK